MGTIRRLTSRTLRLLLTSALVVMGGAALDGASITSRSVAHTPAVAPATDPGVTQVVVQLEPSSGYWGTVVTATTTGSCDGELSFAWGSGGYWTPAISKGSTFTSSSTIPSDFVPGTHDVAVTCDGYHPFGWAPATFTVLETRVKVAPSAGGIGTAVTATAPGLCAGPVRFSWVDADKETWSLAKKVNGAYVATTRVPAGFLPGRHLVSASCDTIEDDDFDWEPGTFTVSLSPVVVTPASGPPGTEVTATVEGVCRGTVSFRWVGSDEPWAVGQMSSGYRATSRVPGSFTAGPREVVAVCDLPRLDFEWPPGLFRVAERVLSVTPVRGPAGTVVTATAQGVCDGTVTFRWVSSDAVWASAAGGGDTFTATTTVPDTLDPGRNEVAAHCDGVDVAEFDWTPAAFTVTVVVDPKLSLDPDVGRPGTTVTAEATGFGCPSVVFLWYGEVEVATSQVSDGRATAQVEIPDDFAARQHDLVARCASDDRQRAVANFTVSPALLTLDIDPREGAAGTEITAVASGFDCAEVIFVWDGGQEVSRAVVTTDGTARASIPVPEDFTAAHDLVARCAEVSAQAVSATFTVASAGGVPWLWWVVAAALVGALLAPRVLRGIRERSDRDWLRAHVNLAPGAAARWGPSVAEAPTDPRVPDVTMRLEAHADPGTHAIEEVEDEHR